MKGRKNKLGTNLLLAFGTMVILIIMITGLAIFRLNQINSSLNNIVDKYNKRVELSNILIQDVNQVSINIRNILVSYDITYMETQSLLIDENLKKYDIDKNKLKQLIVLKDDKKLMEELESRGQIASIAIKEVSKEAMDPELTEEQLQILIDKVQKAEKDWSVSLSSIVTFENNLTAQAQNNAKTDTKSAIFFMFILGIVSVLVAITYGYYILRNITDQMKGLVSAANKLADGDLTSSLKPKSKDEIGQTVIAINNAVQSLRATINTVTIESNEIILSSSKSRDMFKAVNSEVQQISAATQQISAGMQQSSASVEEVTSMATTVKEEANITYSKAKEGVKLAIDIQEEGRCC